MAEKIILFFFSHFEITASVFEIELYKIEVYLCYFLYIYGHDDVIGLKNITIWLFKLKGEDEVRWRMGKNDEFSSSDS